jgi:hypothetical protein
MSNNTTWLAGLLEGEGSFGNRGNCLIIQLSMTDRDIVERAAKLMGAKSIFTRAGLKPRHKQQYSITVAGDNAALWMAAILPYMGERRSAKIKSLLPLREKVQRNTPCLVTCGHTDKYRFQRSCCDSCYKKDWYRRNLERVKAANRQRYTLKKGEGTECQ